MTAPTSPPVPVCGSPDAAGTGDTNSDILALLRRHHIEPTCEDGWIIRRIGESLGYGAACRYIAELYLQKVGLA